MNLAGCVVPDANVWLAYVLSGHPHHQKVRERWPALEPVELAFCRVTQLAFFRLLTNPEVMGAAIIDAATAWDIYRRLLKEQKVSFRSESSRFEERWQQFTQGSDFSHKLWTDAYLAAFARSAGITLLTLDRGMKRFPDVAVECW